MNYQYETLANDNDFEEFLLLLFNLKYSPSFELYKSQGSSQHGVDIYSPEHKIAIQAKKKDLKRPEKSLEEELCRDLDECMEKIKEFPFPINKLYFSTTTRKFGKVQDKAIEISLQGDIPVQFLSWGDIEKEIPFYPTLRENYYPFLANNSHPEIIYIELEQDVQQKKTDSYELIDSDYWAIRIMHDDDKRNESLARYYTHIHTSLVPRVIANEGFFQNVDPEKMFETDFAGKKEQKLISQVLDEVRAGPIGMVSILGESGAGKSTFLYNLAKRYYESYNTFVITKFSLEAANELIQYLNANIKRDLPILLLADNVRDIFDDLPDYLKVLTGWTFNNQCQVILLCAERETRYNDLSLNSSRRVEEIFEGNVHKIIFRNALDKNDIFERVMPLLVPESSITPNQRKEARKVFCNDTISGISESVYNLIKFLKRESEIDFSHYEFDWDEWREFIKRNPDFKEFEYLFAAVACFSYFGISLPTDYAVSFFDSNLLRLTEAIQLMGFDKSPIAFQSLEHHHDTLTLKNEFVANWFFDNKSNVGMAQSFFQSFLTKKKLPHSAWLYRKINKLVRNGELVRSPFGGLLNLQQASSLLENQIPELGDEEVNKNLLELGLNYLVNDVKKAEDTFKRILKLDENSIYALYQLAELNSQNPNTYQNAYNYYVKILSLDPDSIHAITGLYRLSESSLFTEKSQVNTPEYLYLGSKDIASKVAQLSPHTLNLFVIALFKNRDSDLLETILMNEDLMNRISAECYFKVAESLAFEDKNIEKKAKYFEIAWKKDRKNISSGIRAAVFFYRITKFGQSTSIKNSLMKAYPERAKQIETNYFLRIGSTQKLYLPELASTLTEMQFKKALTGLFEFASRLYMKNAPAISVMQGYHILITICAKTYSRYPRMYFDAAKRIGAIHLHNAEKPGWNNLTAIDNRLSAERMFENLFKNTKTDLEVNSNLLWTLYALGKADRILQVCNQILAIHGNKSVPVYSMLKGDAYSMLGDHTAATYHYSCGYELCEKWKGYVKEKYYKTERARLLSKLVKSICECLLLNLDSVGFNKNDAIAFFNRIGEHNKESRYVQEARDKLNELS